MDGIFQRLTSGQARKGVRLGHPELSVECPQCHSVIGRRCFMKPGLLGITHTARKVLYNKQRMGGHPEFTLL